MNRLARPQVSHRRCVFFANPRYRTLAKPNTRLITPIVCSTLARTPDFVRFLPLLGRVLTVDVAHPVGVLDLRDGHLGVRIPCAAVRLDQADDVIRVRVAQQDRGDLLRLDSQRGESLGARPATGPSA